MDKNNNNSNNKSEIAFRVNLNNLKRQDSAIVDIVERATHVVVYEYLDEQWVSALDFSS